ncbi:MAG: T9SS type A sorting domain-containing protein, partial [Gemmatimonadetes bacterium]|nr:T9SS type A sorting domain-containing protein [Gemmatimonadota bacterium]
QRYPNQAGADKCIEADNNEFGFDAVCRSNPVVANATFLGSNGAGLDTYGVHFRRGTDFQFFNSIIAFSNNEAVRISDDATVARGLNPFPGVGCNTAAPEVGAHDRIAVSTFPNPVVARTQFSFSMPEAGHAALDIFDVSGRRVASVVNASLSAGPHSIDWTPENGLVGGTYFYRLDAAGAPTTGKLVLVR